MPVLNAIAIIVNLPRAICDCLKQQDAFAWASHINPLVDNIRRLSLEDVKVAFNQPRRND